MLQLNVFRASRTLLILTAALAAILAVGCTDRPIAGWEGSDGTSDQPVWVQDVIPGPGADATVPDAVEVDHAITGSDEDVRLLVNGVDVTTYATLEAGKIRYESGDGPVVLGTGHHTAEVQRVLLRTEEVEFRVLDSYTWEFRVA